MIQQSLLNLRRHATRLLAFLFLTVLGVNVAYGGVNIFTSASQTITDGNWTIVGTNASASSQSSVVFPDPAAETGFPTGTQAKTNYYSKLSGSGDLGAKLTEAKCVKIKGLSAGDVITIYWFSTSTNSSFKWDLSYATSATAGARIGSEIQENYSTAKIVKSTSFPALTSTDITHIESGYTGSEKWAYISTPTGGYVYAVKIVSAGPVDPTATFSNANYEIGGTLDLATLFDSNSEGAVTYTVKDAGTTGATIVGSNFTATAAGTAVVTASQAAVADKYNAKSWDATITVTAPVTKYAVNFSAGEGTGTMAAVQYAEGATVTLPSCGFTAPDGKEFDAWTSGDVTITDGKFTMPANAVTVTATWKDLPVIDYLIKIEPTSKTAFTITGSVGGTGAVATLGGPDSNGGYKLNSEGAYMAFTLASGYFEPGDKVIAYCTTAQSKKFTVSTGTTEASVIGSTSGNWHTGENEYVLPETLGENVNTLYVARIGSGTYAQNPNILWVKVVRPVKHIVSFDMQGATSTAIADKKVVDGEKATKPADPEKEGFNFVKWVVASTEADYDWNAAVTADVALKAVWADPALAPKTVYLNLANFTDWETANAYLQVWDGTSNVELTKVNDCSNNHLYSAEVVASATTLYFKRCNPNDHNDTWNQISIELGTDDMLNVSDWTTGAAGTYVAPAFTITYKANGGTGEDVVVNDLACGASHTIMAANTFARTNWTFLTWKDQDGAAHTPGDEIEVSKNITLYAHWETWSVYGNFDGNWKDYYFVNNTVKVAMDAETSYSYKIKHQQTDVTDAYYGNAGTMTSENCTGWNFASDKGNAGITSVAAGKYTFTLVNKTPQISVVYPVPQTSISEATTWDWSTLPNTEINLSNTSYQNTDVLLASYDGFTAPQTFNTTALIVNGQYLYRNANGAKFMQVNSAKFNTTVPGVVEVTFANTGNNEARCVSINDQVDTEKSASNNTNYVTATAVVTAGEVLIKGVQQSNNDDKMLRISKITFSPTLSASTNVSGYGTFSCAYQVKVEGEGVNVYTATVDAETKAIVCHKINSGVVPAGKGVLVYSDAASTNWTATPTAEGLADGESDLYDANQLLPMTLANGSLAEVPATNGTSTYVFILSGNNFKKYTGTTFVHNKAYFNLGFDPTASGAPMRIVFATNGTDTATAIDAVENGATVEKIIENGQLIIIKNGIRYNVQGMMIK